MVAGSMSTMGPAGVGLAYLVLPEARALPPEAVATLEIKAEMTSLVSSGTEKVQGSCTLIAERHNSKQPQQIAVGWAMNLLHAAIQLS
jgi:hypothetical protein